LNTRRALSRLGDPPFLVLASILLAVFLVTRLPFFWYYPRVDLSLDSGSYLDIANTIRAGHWPRFIFRTPGYPLLLWAVTSLVDRWIAVIFVQNLLSLASALCLVHSVRRLRRSLALPATIALCGFLGSSQVLIYDISLLSDSLYTSMLLLVVAALLAAFATDRAAWFAATSAGMALAILVRPAGAYLAVLYGAVLLYLLWNRFRPRAVAWFAAPFPALLLGFCAYNLATIGQFVISPFAEANLAGATALFWEQDPRLPERVNKALEGLPDSYEKTGITKEDLRLVRTSWDVGPLFEIYAKAYNRLVWSAGWGSGTRFGAGDYLHNRTYIRDVSVIAIRRHPALYAKYVWVNLVTFFEGIGYKFDVYSSLRYRSRGQLPGEAQAFGLKGEGDGPALSGATPAPPAAGRDDAGVSAAEYCLGRLQLAWQGLHGLVFQNILWSWAYLAMLAASFVQLVRFRGRHLGAFLLFVLTLIPLGASLVVCLVETATDRYSYPTQFVCYLSVALSPLLLRKSLGDMQDPASAREN
jgi:Dolichyl-phosphate-mannose-protein mannosyltransferase